MYGIIIKILSINTWEVKLKGNIKRVAQETAFLQLFHGYQRYPVSENTRNCFGY